MSENTQGNLALVPSLQVSSAIDRVKVLGEIIKVLREGTLVKNTDYGVIPGTGDKPTLLLPGMEKLMRALNAVPEYIEKRVIVDYDKPLFHYEYECRLIEADTGLAIPGGRGLGLCTSYESSFRWRKAERVCPECGQATIIKGKEQYGGGWLCFKKKGGCGAKFPDGDQAIESQEVGRVENPDIFDQVNAIMKRAKKRALGDAIKGAANVSEFFTVDLEDLPINTFTDTDVIEGEIDPEPTPADIAKAFSTEAQRKHDLTGAEVMEAIGVKERLGEYDWSQGTDAAWKAIAEYVAKREATTEPETTPELDDTSPAVWGESEQTDFQLWAADEGFTKADMLKALDVTDFAEFQGSLDDAKQVAMQWRDAQAESSKRGKGGAK